MSSSVTLLNCLYGPLAMYTRRLCCIFDLSVTTESTGLFLMLLTRELSLVGREQVAEVALFPPPQYCESDWWNEAHSA